MSIDLPHLVAQTAGDDALQREILALFAGQMNDVAGELARLAAVAATDPGGRENLILLLHRSRGAALAIGAFALAYDLAFVEAKLAAGAAIPSMTIELDVLRERVLETADHAASLIAARPHAGLAKAGESG